MHRASEPTKPDGEPVRNPLPWPTILLAILAVVILHCTITFFLYRGRVIGRWPLADYDSVVFGLPLLLALAGYTYLFAPSSLLRRMTPANRVAGILGFSILAAFLSLWCSLFLAFNSYGT